MKDVCHEAVRIHGLLWRICEVRIEVVISYIDVRTYDSILLDNPFLEILLIQRIWDGTGIIAVTRMFYTDIRTISRKGFWESLRENVITSICVGRNGKVRGLVDIGIDDKNRLIRLVWNFRCIDFSYQVVGILSVVRSKNTKKVQKSILYPNIEKVHIGWQVPMRSWVYVTNILSNIFGVCWEIDRNLEIVSVVSKILVKNVTLLDKKRSRRREIYVDLDNFCSIYRRKILRASVSMKGRYID